MKDAPKAWERRRYMKLLVVNKDMMGRSGRRCQSLWQTMGRSRGRRDGQAWETPLALVHIIVLLLDVVPCQESCSSSKRIA